jgi:hypothetical protein
MVHEDQMSRMLCFFFMIGGDVALFMQKSGYQIKRMYISVLQTMIGNPILRYIQLNEIPIHLLD